jgi:thioredoxin reductase
MEAASQRHPIYDVIIVGAGPAGLSGALALGRCRRHVLVLDDGLPRNAPALEVRGFLTREGMSPATLREIAFAQLEPYHVELVTAHVVSAAKHDGSFVVSARDQSWTGRRLLLATGVRDRWSDIPGVPELAGRGVFQCPYCDGWEVRDRDLGIYAPGDDAADAALALKTWSSRVTLFTGGPGHLDAHALTRLGRHGVRCIEAHIDHVVGSAGELTGVRLSGGEIVPLEALFIHAGQEPRNVLAAQLGCHLERAGKIQAGPKQQSSVPGLFVAGDLALDIQAVAVAVADGYRAACAINRELREEDFP